MKLGRRSMLLGLFGELLSSSAGALPIVSPPQSDIVTKAYVDNQIQRSYERAANLADISYENGSRVR